MERNGDHIVIRALRFFIVGLFFLIICYLTVLSGFSTTAIRYEEHSYLIRDSVWINLLAECLFLMGLYAGERRCSGGKGAGIKPIADCVLSMKASNGRCTFLRLLSVLCSF